MDFDGEKGTYSIYDLKQSQNHQLPTLDGTGFKNLNDGKHAMSTNDETFRIF